MSTTVYISRERQDPLSLIRSFASENSIQLPNDAVIARESGKKPLLSPPCGVFFSVTHSGEYWACAVSDVAVGLDIERHRERPTESIARRFFHRDEAEYLKSGDAASFFDVWTAKEAYVKFTGEGIGDGFSTFAAADKNGLKQRIKSAHMTRLPTSAGYSMTLATEGKTEITVLFL